MFDSKAESINKDDDLCTEKNPLNLSAAPRFVTLERKKGKISKAIPSVVGGARGGGNQTCYAFQKFYILRATFARFFAHLPFGWEVPCEA